MQVEVIRHNRSGHYTVETYRKIETINAFHKIAKERQKTTRGKPWFEDTFS